MTELAAESDPERCAAIVQGRIDLALTELADAGRKAQAEADEAAKREGGGRRGGVMRERLSE